MKSYKKMFIKDFVTKIVGIRFQDFVNKFDKLSSHTLEVLKEESLDDTRNCFMINNGDNLISLVNMIDAAHESPNAFKKRKVVYADQTLSIRFSYKDLQWRKESSGLFSFCKAFNKRVDQKYSEILEMISKENRVPGKDIEAVYTGLGLDEYQVKSVILSKSKNRYDTKEDLDANVSEKIQNVFSAITVNEIEQLRGNTTGYTMVHVLAKLTNSTREAARFAIQNSYKNPFVTAYILNSKLDDISEREPGKTSLTKVIEHAKTSLLMDAKYRIVDVPLVYSYSYNHLSRPISYVLSYNQYKNDVFGFGLRTPKDSMITINKIFLEISSKMSPTISYNHFVMLSLKDILDLYALAQEDAPIDTSEVEHLVIKRSVFALKTVRLSFISDGLNQVMRNLKNGAMFSEFFDLVTRNAGDLIVNLGMGHKINFIKTASRRFTWHQMEQMMELDSNATLVKYFEDFYEKYGKPCKLKLLRTFSIS